MRNLCVYIVQVSMAASSLPEAPVGGEAKDGAGAAAAVAREAAAEEEEEERIVIMVETSGADQCVDVGVRTDLQGMLADILAQL